MLISTAMGSNTAKGLTDISVRGVTDVTYISVLGDWAF